MRKLNCVTITCCIFCLLTMAADPAPAQTFTTLHSFDNHDGSQPYGPLIQSGGIFYGTTRAGGRHNGGTVFTITSGGALTTIYDFCSQGGHKCTDGAAPQAGLILGPDGGLYGTTLGGGTGGGFGSGFGTVFQITSSGVLTTLHSFQGSDGADPLSLVLGTDGNFYGTTSLGGMGGHICLRNKKYVLNYGTAFKMTPSGSLTTLYSFCSRNNCPDGSQPEAGLVEGSDGNFYGTTAYGGTGQKPCGGDCGTVFKITPDGVLTTLHKFHSTDRAIPEAALVQASDGNFYGTTFEGGAGAYSTGTAFKMTADGVLTTIYTFCSQGGGNCTDGANPGSALIQSTDGNLYGTTIYYGAHPQGTVFEMTTSGVLTTLHGFDNTDGANPMAPLVLGANGTLYGTTYGGGPMGYGTVFSLSVGLAPFVKP